MFYSKMIWTSILLIFNILVSHKIFEVKSQIDYVQSLIELELKKLEAEDHIVIMEALKQSAEEDKCRPTATGYDLLEDNEYSAITSLYQEFERARLEKKW